MDSKRPPSHEFSDFLYTFHIRTRFSIMYYVVCIIHGAINIEYVSFVIPFLGLFLLFLFDFLSCVLNSVL